MLNRKEMTPKQHEQELRQIRELRATCDGKCEDPDDQLQEDQQDSHIGATNEEVKELLRRCGCKLGVDYGEPVRLQNDCCGNCFYFDGEVGDGVQFCDECEMYVRENGYCFRHKKKYVDAKGE